MAIKDEYEVARLYTDGSFERQLGAGVRELGQARVPSRAAAARAPRQAHRASEEAEFRAVDDARLPAAGAAALPARHVRSTRSAAPPSGAGSGSFSPNTRRCSTRSRRSSPPTITTSAVALAAYPRKIRGFGHVKQAQARAGARRARAAAEGVPRAGARRRSPKRRSRPLTTLERAAHDRVPIVGTCFREPLDVHVRFGRREPSRIVIACVDGLVRRRLFRLGCSRKLPQQRDARCIAIVFSHDRERFSGW